MMTSPTTTNDDLLAVLDGHALFHRSFHAFPDQMTTASGMPVNAVYGFTRMLLDVYRVISPRYLVLTFDRPTPTFRHHAYGPYKAHRPPLPESMRAQYTLVREVVDAFAIPIYELDGFEADDLIGTIARHATERDLRTVIATGDLDTLQLINEKVRVTFARSPRRGEYEYFDVEAVKRRYGFGPEHITDFKSLVGDTSDNIPGVPGIGEKTASKLIQQYGTLEQIIEHVGELAPRTRSLIEQHRDQAVHSKYLATIVTTAPITLDLDGAKTGQFDQDAVMRAMYKFEFYSLTDKLPTTANVSVPVATPVPAVAAEDPSGQLSLFAGEDLPPELARPAPMAAQQPVVAEITDVVTVASPEVLRALARTLESAALFAFDLETDSTSEIHAHIVGLSFSVSPGEAFYIPVGHSSEASDGLEQLPLAEVLDALRPAFANPAVGKVGHNAKFDMMVLMRHGVEVRGVTGDTMIAAYLLNPGRRGLGLKELSFELLHVRMTPITDLIGQGRKQISMAEAPISSVALYAGADADITLRLREKLEPELVAKGVERIYHEIEVPLISVLAEIELHGVKVDPDLLRRMSQELDEQLEALVRAIYASVGHEFNLNSPKQLGEVLFGELQLPSGRRTKTGYSVDASVLEGLSGQHEMVDTLLEYRQLSKLKSTYVDGLLELLDEHDHRVHTSFSQVVAATGRLSSSNPNLQNIPVRTEVGRRIRRAFIAAPDTYLLTADYSQIELRILAHITHEPGLVEAFERDEDVHAATAARLFKVPLDEVTPDQRRLAKTVNFGVLYGQSGFGLARTTGMSTSEAVEFIHTYERTFPLVQDYIKRTLAMARGEGYVQTLLGRKRFMPDMASLPVVQRQAVEREAINMPIQGSNADMIKLAMIHLDKELRARKLAAQMILQVHDELVLEVPDAELAACGELVPVVMVQALPLDVPIKVEMKLGRNWYEVRPYTL